MLYQAVEKTQAEQRNESNLACMLNAVNCFLIQFHVILMGRVEF